MVTIMKLIKLTEVNKKWANNWSFNTGMDLYTQTKMNLVMVTKIENWATLHWMTFLKNTATEQILSGIGPKMALTLSNPFAIK